MVSTGGIDNIDPKKSSALRYQRRQHIKATDCLSYAIKHGRATQKRSDSSPDHTTIRLHRQSASEASFPGEFQRGRWNLIVVWFRGKTFQLFCCILNTLLCCFEHLIALFLGLCCGLLTSKLNLYFI